MSSSKIVPLSKDKFITLLIELQLGLKKYFNEKSLRNHDFCEEKCRSFIESFTEISLNKAGYILRAIFFPFMCSIMDEENSSLALSMVSLVNWWLKSKPEKAPDKQLIEAIVRRKCYLVDKLDVKSCLENKTSLVLTSQASEDTLEHLFKHLENNNGTSSHDCDNLIQLIEYIMKFDNFKFRQLAFLSNYRPIWSLYFNPLTNGRMIDELVNLKKVEIPFNLTGSSINVLWSDNRKSENLTIYERKTIDFMVKDLDSNELEKVINKINWNEIAEMSQYKDHIVRQLDELQLNKDMIAVELLEKIKENACFLINETDLVLNMLRKFPSLEGLIVRCIQDSIRSFKSEIKINILGYLNDKLKDCDCISSKLKIYLLILRNTTKEERDVIKHIDFDWLDEVIKKGLNQDCNEDLENIVSVLSGFIEQHALLVNFLSNFIETKKQDFLIFFDKSWCQQSKSIFMKQLNFDKIQLVKKAIESCMKLSNVNSLELLIHLLNEILELNVNDDQVKDCFENSSFLMVLLSILKQTTQ